MKKNETQHIKSVHHLLEFQAKRTPDAAALTFRGQTLTYRELEYYAGRIAVSLSRYGAGPDCVVGLLMDRCNEMIVSVFGILKSGGAYLPVDPENPRSRIEYVLDDSGTKILLTSRSTDAANQCQFNGTVLYYEDLIAEECAPLPGGMGEGHNLAYVIYTSGSTGNPKGVAIEHHSVCNFVEGMQTIMDLSGCRTMLSLTTISFDIFAFECYLPLAVGMEVLISDPVYCYDYLCGRTADAIQTTPSTYKVLMNDKRNLELLRSAKILAVGGEAFPPALLTRLQQTAPAARIYNLYGPTETTVYSLVKDLTHENQVTIGRPILNTGAYIVDESRNPVPQGETGELYLSGSGLARGYYRRKELTAERFVDVPFAPGELMYRTGDLCRVLENGEFSYLSRMDNQVKIRGFRVELGEIEQALSRVPGVNDCIVAPKKHDGEDYLVGYYLSDQEISVSEIISHLTGELPQYMIPGHYMRLAKIPLTPNNKADRLALPVPGTSRPRLVSAFRSPVTAKQKELAAIWSRVLKRDSIGIGDNFFEVGGNSVLLSEVHLELQNRYGDLMQVADLFSNPTIEALGQYLEECCGGDHHTSSVPGQSGHFADALRYQVDAHQSEQTRWVCKQWESKLFDYTAACFAYLIFHEYDVPAITLLFSNEIGQIFQVQVIFDQIEDFKALVHLVADAVNEEYTGNTPPVFTHIRAEVHGSKDTQTAGWQGFNIWIQENENTLVLSMQDNNSKTEKNDQERFFRKLIHIFCTQVTEEVH